MPRNLIGVLVALTLLGACKKQVAREERTAPAQRESVGGGAATRASTPVERPARLAGAWYAADPGALGSELDRYLAAATHKPPPGKLLGIIAPHAGYRFSGPAAAFAHRLLVRAKPRRVFVLGPSHYTAIRAVALVRGRRFATPLGALQIDDGARRALLRDRLFVDDPEPDAREHSVEMQMPLLRRVAPTARVVPMIVGRLTLAEVRRVAAAIRAQLRPGDLVLASSDFTHYGPNYGYQPFRERVPERLRELDMQAWALIRAGALEPLWRFKQRTRDTICGFYPISVLMALVGGRARGVLMHYDTSGRITDDFSNSVSYVAAAFAAERDWDTLPGAKVDDFLTPTEQRAALRIARAALRRHFADGGRYDPLAANSVPPGHLREQHGVFVTLKRKRDHSLRGCIGNVGAGKPLYRGIVDNALNAALRDPRFAPLARGELDEILIEVSVLTPPEPVDGPQAIVIGRDGIILEHDGHSALFLPQVAVEQGWGLVATLSALARKAGLGPDGWRRARYSTFRGHVYDETQL